jgi:hypothetical protein
MKNLIGLWCNLFRAIEIAKSGNFSISIYMDKDYKEGFDDYEMIKTFCKGWFENFVIDGDLKIEISKPYLYEGNKNCETIQNIADRIEKALLHKKPEIILDSVSQPLLKVATEKIGLSLKQVEKIKEISAIIAQLDLRDNIEVIHVAEAIQYSHVNSDINLENKSLYFGDMINIKIGEIYPEDALKAIEYLMDFTKNK